MSIADDHSTSSELAPTETASTSEPSTSEPTVKKLSREEVVETFGVEPITLKNFDWVVLIWMSFVHIGAVVALFNFSWTGLGLCALFHWITCSLGITMTFHRCLSHRSFKLKNPAKFFALLCGVLAGEGTPLRWSAVHRVHHGHSDQPGDPHSPLEGPWWSHLWWMFIDQGNHFNKRLLERYVPDLYKDKTLMMFERTYAFWVFGSVFVFYALFGWAGVLWGVCMRMVISYHSTWFVNSATHLWGYRNYETTDQSRNLWWVAILSYGEGWHNNHHAHPSIAPAGHRWWELDPTMWAIRGLELIGQATEVKDEIPFAQRKSDSNSSANPNSPAKSTVAS